MRYDKYQVFGLMFSAIIPKFDTMRTKIDHRSCSDCPVREISMLRGLTTDEVKHLDESKNCVFFRKNQILMHEGSKASGVYCVNSGKAKVSRLGIDGKEQIIRFIKSGDLIGYRSLISDENLSASVTALDDTHACYVPKSVLFDFIQENPRFSLDLMKQACHELGEAGKIITNLAQKSVRERLAEVLLLLRSTFGENADGELDVSLTREELANMVGTATESVIRLMSEFKSDGHIESKGRKIKVIDPVSLAKIGKVFD